MTPRNRRNGGHEPAPTLPMGPATLIQPQQQGPLIHVDPRAFEADFEPTGELVLLRTLKRKRSASEVQLPEGVSDGRPNRSQIVKVGPGQINVKESGEQGKLIRVPMDERFKPGAVVYPVFIDGKKLNVGKEEYIVTPASAIVAFSHAPPESLEE